MTDGSQRETAEEQRALASRVEELRRDAAFSEALSLARELLGLRRAGSTHAYEVRDAERLAATLERIVALPEADRRELAGADALTPVLHDHYAADRLTEALETARRQLETRRRLLGAEHPDTLASLHDTALVLQDLGDLDAAEAPTREAAALARAIHGEEHPDVANTQNSVARLLWYRGDLPGAERELREAVARWQRLLGDDPYVALGLFNLGRLHHDQGHYAAAEPLYRAALRMRRELDGPESESVVWTMSSLAGLLADQGDHDASIRLQRDAVRLGEKLAAETPARGQASGVSLPASYGFAVSTLARVLEGAGRHDEALEVSRRSTDLARRQHGDAHAAVSAELLREGRILAALGRLEDAREQLEDAARVREAALGSDHPEMAFCLRGLGHVSARLGQMERAGDCLQRASALLATRGWRHHPGAIGVHIDLAVLARARKDADEAIQQLERAAGRYEVARLRAGSGLARALAVSEPYSHFAAAHLTAGRIEEAWPMLERSLARVLADRVIAARERPVAGNERASERRLAAEQSDLERRLATLEGAVGEDTHDVTDELQRVRTRLLGVEAALGEHSQRIAARETSAGGDPLLLSDLQSSLSPERAVVGWLDVSAPFGAPEAWGFVIRDRGPVVWVPIGEPTESIERLVSFSNRMERIGASALGAEPDEKDDPTRREIWLQRLAPLTPHLEGVTELIVVPSNEMAGLPLEALDTPDGAIVDSFAVAYAPSARLHHWLSSKPTGRRRRRPERALVLGDPPFRPEHAGPPPSRSEGIGGRRQALRISPDALPRLAGTRAEAEQVSTHFAQATLLVGTDASETALVRMALADELRTYDVLHLATHAVVNPDAPELSALVLSQLDLPDPVEAALAGDRVQRGFVTGRDIVREWRLDAELVALSACGTGTGRRVRGEGLVGFVHAFLEAGARSVLVSLWPVDDRATARLMTSFYSHWLERGASKAIALRDAKRELRDWRDADGRRPYTDPFYWSPFVLFGDPS